MIERLRPAALVFIAAIVQVSMLGPHASIFGGTPDVLLVTLVCVALLRGSITGAVAGFAGGLIVDISTMGTLGVTALLLTVAGYWAGRYGETTGRNRAHAVPLAVAVITILVAVSRPRRLLHARRTRCPRIARSSPPCCRRSL